MSLIALACWKKSAHRQRDEPQTVGLWLTIIVRGYCQPICSGSNLAPPPSPATHAKGGKDTGKASTYEGSRNRHRRRRDDDAEIGVASYAVGGDVPVRRQVERRRDGRQVKEVGPDRR